MNAQKVFADVAVMEAIISVPNKPLAGNGGRKSWVLFLKFCCARLPAAPEAGRWTNDKNSYGAVLDYKKTSCYAEIAEHNEDGTIDAYYVGAEGQIASSMMARVGTNNQELFDENQ